jgi:AcrR family transcriptional regulator
MTRRRDEITRTRKAIARAAFELHESVGPAHTTLNAVADRAGVERHTVYRHFPDMVELIRACTQHGMETTGLPDPDGWLAERRPIRRLEIALADLYDYYSRNERLIANILRDMSVMPELQQGSIDYQLYIIEVHRAVLGGFGSSVTPETRAARTLRGLITLALDFGAWRTLRSTGLTNEEAVGIWVSAISSRTRRRT